MRRISCLLLGLALVTVLPHAAWPLFGAGSKLNPGDEAPPFVAPLLEAGDFDLGQHLGKDAVLLDFWSIYCVACLKEMPKLVDIYDRYKDKGLVAVGVDLDSFGTKRVKRFVKGLDFEITYPVVIDKRREVAGKYGVSVLPTTVVVDREGKVIYFHVGYAAGDEAQIEEKVRQGLGRVE